jgi:membrane-bound lytic murein transglycosylase
MLKSQSRTLRTALTARSLGALAATLLTLLLTACGTKSEAPKGDCPVCPTCPVCEPGATARPGEPAQPATPAFKPLQPARWSDLPAWSDDDLRAALPAFLQSCRAFAKRPQWSLWRTACEQAQALPSPSSAALRSFFESRFQPWLLTNPDGSSDGLVTGYYEPLLRGSRTPRHALSRSRPRRPSRPATHRSRRRPAGTQEPAPARSPAGQQGRSLLHASRDHQGRPVQGRSRSALGRRPRLNSSFCRSRARDASACPTAA